MEVTNEDKNIFKELFSLFANNIDERYKVTKQAIVPERVFPDVFGILIKLKRQPHIAAKESPKPRVIHPDKEAREFGSDL